ncbi:MAG: enoyl-CoA hydratase/isomerase family protein [Actinobacteria bacterium]|nr:enoyl-CoA hydratase/isomerase family protein [Actinomycetota bacterium]
MSVSGPVRLEREGELALVPFDSPPVNLYTDALGQGLSDALSELERRAPRAVLFRAEGRVFSGGVDVSLFAALDGPEAAARTFQELVDLGRRVDALDCPSVFAAHALCLTWAFELALACDIILAAEAAKFGLVERVIGLTPAMGGTQRLAERAGSGRAREFVMTGRPYDAATLERWNVVNLLLPNEGFDEAARRYAADLAEGPTRAHVATKQVIRDYIEGGVELANERVPTVAGELFATEDLQRAVQTFLEHGPGKATFQNR